MSEARRIKKFLGLDERPGIEGLARALALRCQSAANVDEILVEGDELTYRIVDCRVQNARKRKGMGFHPAAAWAWWSTGCSPRASTTASPANA